MEAKQLAPWNWFKKERFMDDRDLPVMRMPGGGAYPAPLARLHQEFDQLFEHFLRDMPGAPTAVTDDGWMKPSMDIAATDDAYTITAELPGVEEKDIDVQLVGDTLILHAKKEHNKEETKDNYYCVERSYGSFRRQLAIPEDADPDAISADYKRGVLTLKIPRTAGKSTSAAKRIEVNAA